MQFRNKKFSKKLETALFQPTLPQDVLQLIFIEYRKQETLNHPLETLLLVCKAWAEVCLESPLLWNVFNIVFSIGSEVKRWASLIPKRLAKSGHIVPLYITIVNKWDKSHRRHDEGENELRPGLCLIYAASYDKTPDEEPQKCHCSDEILDGTSSIIKTLSGPNGIICTRWTSLHLHLIGWQINIIRSLVYPTPNLQELIIQGIGCSYVVTHTGPQIFPHTPNLRDLSLIYHIIVDTHSNHGLLRAAPALERLEIQDYFNASPRGSPQILPHLKNLVIRGTWSMPDSSELSFSIPNLTSFTRVMDSFTASFPECGFVIPFKKLHTLGIFFISLRRNPVLKSDSPLTVGLIRLLSKSRNVKRIAGDQYSIWALLLVLSISPRPASLRLTADQLTVCVMERRYCSRIEAALDGDEGVYVIGMGETMVADIERIKELRGWGDDHAPEWLDE